MLLLLSMLACGPKPPPQLDLLADPPALSAAGAEQAPARWWTAFDDPVLDALVDDALRDSLDLRAAWARLDAAQAVVRRERAPLLPSLEASAASSVGTDAPLAGTRRVPLELGLAASYEVDLWGRVRAQVRAEQARVDAAQADLDAAALTLSAEVSRAWFGLQASRSRLSLLQDQEAANAAALELVGTRFDHGRVRQADLLRQQRLHEQSRAARLAEEARRDELEHRLAVLLGRTPQDYEAPAAALALPAPPALPATGLPLDLIERRPDVQAAWHELRAANQEVAVAVRDQLPRLRLGADLEVAPTPGTLLLETWVASAAASLVAPLFEGGARRAEVRRRRALLDEALADYGSAVLAAFQEVEDALAWEQRQAQRVESLRSQAALARERADLLALQHDSGLSPWVDVLEERAAAQALARDLVDAELAWLETRVGLHRALAGPLPLPSPVPPEDPP